VEQKGDQWEDRLSVPGTLLAREGRRRLIIEKDDEDDDDDDTDEQICSVY
jgi:hypothetical protein